MSYNLVWTKGRDVVDMTTWGNRKEAIEYAKGHFQIHKAGFGADAVEVMNEYGTVSYRMTDGTMIEGS